MIARIDDTVADAPGDDVRHDARDDADADADADAPPGDTVAMSRDQAANARGLKMHLRIVELRGATYHVVSPRPATRARFSTNYFHGTWHVLTGRAGAALLARLLWGLAFQRKPNTLVMIDGANIVPTPFEADRGDAIALLPADLTRFDVDHLAALRRRLTTPPTKTIRWHTFGLPAELEVPPSRWHWRWSSLDPRERMSRAAGMICYTAPEPYLRERARSLHHLSGFGMGYLPVANTLRTDWRPEGEFQIFPSFDEDVAAAKVARREVVRAGQPWLATEERAAVWDRRERVLARRREARR